MAIEIKELYKKAIKCSGSPDFESYSQFTDCVNDLKIFKNTLPQKYPHYDKAISAADASINRINYQKEIKYTQQHTEAEFIQGRTMHQMLRSKEKEAWQDLTYSRIEHQSEKNDNTFSDNLINVAILFTLFILIFAYRLVVSNKIGKLKTRNILRSFKLIELAELVNKELFHKIDYKILWFGFKIKDENEGVQVLSAEELRKLNLIYQNVHILEAAFQVDIAKNKINVWKGVNLENEEVQRARDKFLKLIDEKVNE